MKKILIGLLLCMANYLAGADDFYYYKDTKQQLVLNTQYLYVLCNLQSKEALEEKIKSVATVTKFHQDIYHQRLVTKYRNSPEWMTNGQNSFAEIKLNNSNLSKDDLLKVVEGLKANPNILNVSFHYTNDGNERFAVTNYVWVKVKDETQIPLLAVEAGLINYSIVGQNNFMPEWVMLGANKNATVYPLQASQLLTQIGLFVCAEPDLRGEAKKDCVNDPLFTNQWGLSNTGQYGGTSGMDTRVCGAWEWTTGSTAVDIAIIDEGFENTHPDLDGNLANTGYSSVTGNTPTVVYGSHGTSCAGIAAAEGNNSLGVSGVARSADLMSVSVDFNSFNWAETSDAFNWARTNGAEILSNSWGWNVPSALFDAAVTNALTLGRGGLGCVVLFSAGNDNLSALIYPKNSNVDLIIVGAMSQCGERKSPTSCDGETWWGSNRGQGLNVMAPGVQISTTDRQGTAGYNSSAGTAGNYTAGFNGTSSACPHAAGVAALILSANACLTQDEVEQIMCETARKVGAYSYTTSISNPFGTWNTEMGYGLLNAEAAVIKAQSKYLQNLSNSTTVTHRSPLVFAGYNVNPSATNGNYVTTAAANVTIEASKAIEFKTGCDMRGNVDATITSVGSCTTW